MSNDQFPIMLLGNDIFNKSNVHTLYFNDKEELAIIAHGGMVDAMPLTLASAD